MRRALSLTIAMTAGMLALAAAPAAAQSFTLTAQLSGAGEATQTANGITTGSFGDATVVLDVTAQTVTWTVRVFNLPSAVTAAHIHVGAPGTAGPTIVNFTVPSPASNDFGFSGSAALSTISLRPDQGIRSAEDFVQAVLGEQTYVNVHSVVNPGGEIRGQLRLVR
jgi:hypothetical protein